MQILQILDSLNYGDAIGNDALAIHQILLENQYNPSIYAIHIGKRIPEGLVKPVSQLPPLSDRDVILYHAAIGTPLNYDVPVMPGKKVMIYHNVTPSHFFHDYSYLMETQTRSGYIGIKYLAHAIDRCIADSEFNKSDLRKMGYKCPIDVCPIVIPFEDYNRTPNQEVLSRYQNDGWTNLLFVGRIAPNKKQEDVIRTFYCYHQKYNQHSRLFLVGNSSGLESYYQRLVAYTEMLGIQDNVIFPGHIRFDEILAYYHLADAFICMSEHEGFCVPLLEAMHFQKPIIAYRSTAVPETLGAGGILLDKKDPEEAAAIIDYVLTHEDVLLSMKEAQKNELKRFEYETVRNRLESIFSNILK